MGIKEIESDIKQLTNSNVNSNNSISQQLYQYTATPVQAWTFAGLLLATPLITKKPVTIPQISGGRLLSIAKKQHVGPSSLSSLLFGGAMGLGGWIIHDGDIESGAGFITAWSTLYLIVNGKSTFNGLRYGKVWPILLTTTAGITAFYHGKRFFFSSS